jgi:RimJ/RimL family protein N-acetyltransferase
VAAAEQKREGEEGAVPGPELVIGRLALSRLNGADSAALFSYRRLPEVSRYQNWEPQCLGDAVAFIDDLATVEFDAPGTWFQFGIRLRSSGRLIGDLGVHFLEDGQQVEIGITLAPESQRLGYGSEALIAVLDYLFGSLGKHRAVASVDPRNTPSLNLMRRVGMRQEAHFRQSLRFKGEWADDVVFATLAPEWLERRQG